MKNTKKENKKGKNLLPLLAGVLLIAVVAVMLLPKVPGGSSSPSAADGEDLVIQVSDIGANASYFDFDADGTTVQVIAVRASDNTVRLALNTCQVCNGSPYAYFEQNGDTFICQNCGNRFASTDVGRVSGGCNPVPITAEIYTEQDGQITVPASFLQENASRFTNWKKF